MPFLLWRGGYPIFPLRFPVEVCVQEGFDFDEHLFRLLSAAYDSDKEIVGISRIEESSEIWVERVACR